MSDERLSPDGAAAAMPGDNPYKSAIAALKRHMDESGKSQRDIAIEMGVSTATINTFLNGKHKTPHAVASRIPGLINLSERKKASPDAPAFRMTSVSKLVTNIISYCHIQGKIGVAYGDAGVGKTMACLEYFRKTPEAIMITASPCFKTVTAVNELLAEELRIREKIARRIFQEAVVKLNGSGRVIIVDEAQHLTLGAINNLRSLTDATSVGIALVGNDEIYSKMRGSGQAAYAQLYNRIGNQAHVAVSQIKEADVRLVFGDAGLTDEAAALLYRVAKTNYGMRGAVNVYVNALISGQISDFSELTAARLAYAAKELKII